MSLQNWKNMKAIELHPEKFLFPNFIKFSLGLIAVRLLSVIIVQSWFVPDETWQSTEIAHNVVFGYGYMTWEWHEKIRSILYPGIFVVFFKFLQILNIDNIFLLVEGPRLISAFSFAIGDICACIIAYRLYGFQSMYWTYICLCTSWFLHYCASRTLSSCFEMVLFMISLAIYPWHQKKSNFPWYLLPVAIGCMIRPTMAPMIFPFCVAHLLKTKHRFALLKHYFYVICLSISFATLIDFMYFGWGVSTLWNFFNFNIISGQANHYGTHPWYWYWGSGLAVIFPYQIGALWGSIMDYQRNKELSIPCCFVIVVFSFIPHKEFRFLLPIMPLLICICGNTISKYILKKEKTGNSWSGKIMLLLFLLNGLIVVFMGLFHQTGPISLMRHLQPKLMEHVDIFKRKPLLFLMPCHSTPLYSHIHVNIPIRFLTCEPNLNGQKDYLDEADIFYEDPQKWIALEYKNFTDTSKPSCLIMFHALKNQIDNVLHEGHYKVTAKFFHTFFPDNRRSSFILLLCTDEYHRLMKTDEFNEKYHDES